MTDGDRPLARHRQRAPGLHRRVPGGGMPQSRGRAYLRCDDSMILTAEQADHMPGAHPSAAKRPGAIAMGGLEAQLGQVGMIGWSRSGSVPVKETVCDVDRDVIDTGVPLAHQAMLVELPVLVAVRSEPLAVDAV